MSQPNAYQVADWNGSSGERWVANQVRLDAMLAGFGEAAIAAAAPVAGERVLDIGCGAGATSRALAQRVGTQGRVLGLDISESLIARARDVAIAGPHLAFEVADASSAALPEAAYDLLFSRFGVMFFEDPTAAFAHMRRALKPGGRIAFVCWRGAGGAGSGTIAAIAASGKRPQSFSPAPEAPGPFAFGDRDRVMRILSGAGFADIRIDALDRSIPFGQGATRAEAIEDALEMAFEVGPLSRALADQPDDIRARAATAVRAAYATKPGHKAVMIDGAAWIVTARA
jgi:SAM-dependent methyltransferase